MQEGTKMPDGTMNLAVPRSDKSVWDAPSFSTRLYESDQERWMAVAIGSVLVGMGMRRGGVTGGLLAVAGGVLATRAAMGRHDLQTLRHRLDETLTERGWRIKDIVEEGSEESFPASDSPGWTTSAATTDR